MVNLHERRQRSLLGCGEDPPIASGDTGDRAPASPVGPVDAAVSNEQESSDHSGDHYHALSASQRQRLGCKKTHVGSANVG